MRSCCQAWCAVFKTVIRMVGLAGMTLRRQASSKRSGSTFEAADKKAFVGDVHDDEIGSVGELAPVGLPRQLAHALSYLARVLGEVPLARGGVHGLHGLEVGAQRDLGVHHDRLAAGEAHQQVGARALPVLRLHRGLQVEVAVLAHAGQLDHPLEVDLPPAAAAVRGPQRGDEVRGLAPQDVLGLGHPAHLLLQRAVGPLPVRLQLLQLGVHVLERRLDGVHQGADPFLTLVEHLARQLQEGVLAVAQDVGGQCLEGGLQVGLRRSPLELGLAAGLQCRHVRFERGTAAPPQGEADTRPHREGGQQHESGLAHAAYVEAGVAGAATATLGSGRTDTGCAVTSLEFR